MIDLYGNPCVVTLVRICANGLALGVGFDPTNTKQHVPWFVYHRRQAKTQWHQYCGPYPRREDAIWWIRQIQDEEPNVMVHPKDDVPSKLAKRATSARAEMAPTGDGSTTMRR